MRRRTSREKSRNAESPNHQTGYRYPSLTFRGRTSMRSATRRSRPLFLFLRKTLSTSRLADNCSSICMELRLPPTGGSRSIVAAWSLWDSVRALRARACFGTKSGRWFAVFMEMILQRLVQNLIWIGLNPNSKHAMNFGKAAASAQAKPMTRRVVCSIELSDGLVQGLNMKPIRGRQNG